MANDSFDLSSLDQFDLDGLSKKGSVAAAQVEVANGKPLIVPIDELIEDPGQPRTEANPGFSPESIAELGASIKAQGVKMPISVKSKNDAGFYVINDGARRYRGSKWAELNEVPIIVDDNFNRVAQLMVNLQREGNTPDEIAKAIAELEEEGVSRTKIAEGMGKNKGFVSEYAKFAQVAPEIRALYDNDECKDVKIINQLDDLLKEYPDAVRQFIADDKGINRRTVGEFVKQLKNPQPTATPASSGGQQENPQIPQASQNNPTTVQQPEATASIQRDPEEVSSGSSQEATNPGEGAQAPSSQGDGQSSADDGAAWPFTPPGAKGGAAVETGETATGDGQQQSDKQTKPAASKPENKGPKILGAISNKVVRLVLERKPKDSAYCWVEFEEGQNQRQVLCSEITLVSVEH